MNPNLSPGARAFLESCARCGGQVSDGPIQRGWGVLPFRGRLAHCWAEVQTRGELTQLRAACGLLGYATKRIPLLGVGSFERCSHCERALMKQT